jgi:parvulin-like peptidyl-prolyl isomerase
MLLRTLLLAVVSCSGLAAAESERLTADQSIRYVNDQVVSLGDVLMRDRMRLADFERRGKPRPTTREERVRFSRESLEELTDEELLVQYGQHFAEERHIHLVDHERIAQSVMERSRALGRGRTLREQAEDRKQIERQQIMDQILGYFESRSANITPAEVQQSYQRHAPEFRRPARAHVLQILLRPSSPAERQEVRQLRVAVFKLAQDIDDEAMKKAVTSRLDAYAVGTPDDQERLLDEAVREIAAMAARTDLALGALQLARDAQQAVERGAKLRDLDGAMRDLDAVRAGLVGKDAEAFKAIAKQVSQGPNASEGGDLGWIEPGSFQPAFDAVVFALKAGQLSQAFKADKVACLVMVVEQVDARSRDFAEVKGEIESTLRREQQRAVRQTAVTMLRSRASIRDIDSIEHLYQ